MIFDYFLHTKYMKYKYRKMLRIKKIYNLNISTSNKTDHIMPLIELIDYDKRLYKMI